MGVEEYWLIDLERSRVEVRKHPTTDGLYASTAILSANEHAQLPLLAHAIAVAAVLG